MAGDPLQVKSIQIVCRIFFEKSLIDELMIYFQLSPIVLSNHAKHNGLSVSMLERILELYQKNAENVSCAHSSDGLFFRICLLMRRCNNSLFKENQRRLVTRLCRSYRALPSILDFYSKQFYDSRLIAQIHANNGPGPQLLKSLQNGGALPQRAKAQVGAGSDLIAEPPFGVSFIDVQGNNVRMKNKKSWRNEAETEKVCFPITFTFCIILILNYVRALILYGQELLRANIFL